MFLLECASDNSLLIKRNESVICDHKTVTCGNLVAFYHGKKKYTGTVKMIDSDENLLKKEIIRIKSVEKKKTKKPEIKNVENISGPQSSKRKSVETKNNLPNKKSKGCSSTVVTPKIQDKNDGEDTDSISDDPESNSLPWNQDAFEESQNLAESDKDKSPVNFVPNSPFEEIETTPKSSGARSLIPSKPLPKRVLAPQTGLRTGPGRNENKDPNNSDLNLEDDDDDDDDDDQDQLIGNLATEKMKHIGNGIYCRRSNYKNGVKGTPSATALARNLLVGVFKREALIESSLAGRSPRAQGSERMKQKNIRLNDKATTAIIKFAKDYARKKNWTGDANESKIKGALAQKIVEVKNEDSKNSSQG